MWDGGVFDERDFVSYQVHSQLVQAYTRAPSRRRYHGTSEPKLGCLRRRVLHEV